VNIAVVGTGYVGLVTGACFAEFGVTVVGVDKDEAKIRSLKDGKVPFFEPGLEELVLRNMRGGRLSFTTEIKEGVEKSLVIFIAVGTPSGTTGGADLRFVKDVAKGIARYMNGYKVVVTKSTVPMGTGAMIRQLIREEQKTKSPFSVVSNPEFLREGAAIEDFMRPNRIVIGAEDPQAIAIMKDLYNPLYLIDTPFVITNVVSAEMVKYASNAFLATKISFVNEMANLCEAVGADVHEVVRGMGLDNRIGRKFLHPGPGFGGSCFPKDTRAVIEMAREHGLPGHVVSAVARVNDEQIPRMVEKITQAAGTLQGKTLCFLGLAFKPQTSDTRESPAMRIIEEVVRAGGTVRAFDPAAMDEARHTLGSITYAKDAYDAAKGADVLVIATEWNEFRNLDWDRMKTALKAPVVVDLRNVYDPRHMRDLGFQYAGVGR
jgi:UDPglucose 6-dehydrogenase